MIGAMLGAQDTITKDLILLGGGHAHVQVVKAFAMRRQAGVRVTLISPDPHTPYSGMLPGLIAGHYSFDQAHIDLNRLCRWASVRWIQGEACGLDLSAQRILFADRPPIEFDVLSIDIGSTPRASDVPGADEFAIPVKPISRFLTRWMDLRERTNAARSARRIAVVGAGAGGVEIVLAARHALRQARSETSPAAPIEFHLFARGEILPEESPALRAYCRRMLQSFAVRLHENETVTAVEKGLLRTQRDGRFEVDDILWVTAAGAPGWPRASGLATDSQGFIAVEQTLRSISHPKVFAAGDIAAMTAEPRPKAGVFAVRQGPVLADNLRRALADRPLRPYRPQRKFLKILACGDKSAIASRGNWVLAGEWVWRWKDAIDRRFMAHFNQLPDVDAPPSLALRLREALSPCVRVVDDKMRCGGCGAKIGADILKSALVDLKPVERADVLAGLDHADDAAIVTTPDGLVNVQSIDSFRAMITDPYRFGAIAASHALGDLYAMGAKPQSALALVTLPPHSPRVVERDMRQMMQGAVETLNAAGASLVGGHSGEGAEMALGFAVTGLARPDSLWRKSGLRTGDVLILTKALGTGALLAGDMRAKARGRDVSAALALMRHSNADAAEILRDHQASACTDVTGFGLAGHLMEMLRASGKSARVRLADIPILPGAREMMIAGVFSTLHAQNVIAAQDIDGHADTGRDIAFHILFDPQTAGGLLAGVSPEQAQSCIAALRLAGYCNATAIGAVTEVSMPGCKITLV